MAETIGEAAICLRRAATTAKLAALRCRVYEVPSGHSWTLNFARARHPWTTNFDETFGDTGREILFGKPTQYSSLLIRMFCSFTGNGCLHVARSRCRGTRRFICPLARDADGQVD